MCLFVWAGTCMRALCVSGRGQGEGGAGNRKKGGYDDLVVRVLDSQSRCLGFKTADWL